MNIIERVHESRRRTNATFPLPSVRDCIRYAITECAECDDARLRMEQPAHLRNNGRNDDPRKEWGQAGYMIISALRTSAVTLEQDPAGMTRDYTNTLSELASALADDAFSPEWVSTDLVYALRHWVAFCLSSGWDAEALIDETCAAFEAKHAPKVVA